MDSDSEFSIKNNSSISYEDIIENEEKISNNICIDREINSNNSEYKIDELCPNNFTILNNINTNLNNMSNDIHNTCTNINNLINTVNNNINNNVTHNNLLPFNYGFNPYIFYPNNNLSSNFNNQSQNVMNHINKNNSNNQNTQINNDNKDKNNKSNKKNKQHKSNEKIKKNRDKANINQDSEIIINNKIVNENKHLKNRIKYLYINKNDKKFRYSLSKYISKTFTGYYNCYDSQCSARGKIQFDFEQIDNFKMLDKFKDDEKFILTIKHNKAYEDHSYKRNKIVKTDFDNNQITEEKLKNFKYLRLFLKEFCIRNKNLKFELLFEKLLVDYPNIKLTLTNNEKSDIINKYKKVHELTDEELEEIDFNKILNIKILLKRILSSVSKLNLSKKTIKDFILDMKDNTGYNITTNLKVEFSRKNKIYKKDIFILMNSNMKKNIN